LKKAKAMFEIKELPEHGLYPEKAIKASQRAFGAVYMLVRDCEDARNAGVFAVTWCC
jgi:hypothetical protein